MRRQRGLAGLELAVVLAVIVVLAGVLLERVLYYEEYAEMTAVSLTRRQMESALRQKAAALMMEGQLARLRGLAGANPLEWLARPPGGYLGGGDFGRQVDGGSWYFDAAARQVVYRPRLALRFQPGRGGREELRWQVVPVDPGGSSPWLRLKTVEGGRWFSTEFMDYTGSS